MAASSSDVPGYNAVKRTSQPEAGAASGTRAGGDPTAEPGQYPPGNDHGIFGGALPTGTGAPGTGGGEGGGDPTTEAGQTSDDFTGQSGASLTDTGAPGSGGASVASGAGGDSVTFTRPGSYLSGSYASDTVRGNVDGPASWTEANASGYGTDGPKLPGMHEPEAGSSDFQPGGGRVMRGGRAVRG
jgi:hypothetical protein